MLEEWSHAKLKSTWEYTTALWYHCSAVTQSKPSLYDDAIVMAEQLQWKSMKTFVMTLKKPQGLSKLVSVLKAK